MGEKEGTISTYFFPDRHNAWSLFQICVLVQMMSLIQIWNSAKKILCCIFPDITLGTLAHVKIVEGKVCL